MASLCSCSPVVSGAQVGELALEAAAVAERDHGGMNLLLKTLSHVHKRTAAGHSSPPGPFRALSLERLGIQRKVRIGRIRLNV